MRFRELFLSLLVVFLAGGGRAAEPDYTVYLAPNTHGTIAGWLVNFDSERSHTLNNYLSHLERVASDGTYRIAISEVPNVMALLKFAPERTELLKRLIRERKVELVNGFFIEPSVSLSGGEALAQMAVLGLRWYDEVFSLRPRLAWMIDICGAHSQLPQIVAASGLEGVVFCRNNPMPKDAFWWVAPDGSRTLAIALGQGYAGVRNLFNSAEGLNPEQMEQLGAAFDRGRSFAASPRHLLMLAGGGDYSLAPRRGTYPKEFLENWRQRFPKVAVKMATPGEYVDALQTEMRSGRTALDEYRGGAAYSYNAFWMNMPEVKRDFRLAEHRLQAAEMIATAASIVQRRPYPSREFYASWVQMMINMDRNVLWGAGSGSPFYDSHHWNAWDRFGSVRGQVDKALDEGIGTLTSDSAEGAIALFNPLNWKRSDPIEITLPLNQHPVGVECEARPGRDQAICFVPQPATGITSIKLAAEPAEQPEERPFQPEITTEFYTVRFDPASGSIVSLRSRASGKEYLGGAANVIQAESVEGVVKDPTNWMAPRPLRKMVDSTSKRKVNWQSFQGPLAITVIARAGLTGGSSVERRVTLYRKYPRIDFETTVDLRAPNLLVAADFPLAGTVVERTRGIPFGFSTVDPRNSKAPIDYFLMADHRTYGFSDALQPAVRWSDYRLEGGGGVALLDRGLTSHELNGNTVTLALVNAQSHYRGLQNILLEGQGMRRFEYALLPHEGHWGEAAIPKRAWEYNSPVIAAEGRRAVRDVSFLATSDNVIVEAVRRVDADIEVRLAEWAGREGEAAVTLKLPHQDARITNLMGEKARPLQGKEGSYSFSVKPQQIVTLRFLASSAVPRPAAIREWAPLVPPSKRAPLEMTESAKGYPAVTREPTTQDFGAAEKKKR